MDPAVWAKAVDRHGDVNVNGLSDHTELTIDLSPFMAPGLRKEILLHEVAHCVHAAVGLGLDLNDEKVPVTEEQVVTRTAPVWLQVLRDNPKLLAYLTEDA